MPSYMHVSDVPGIFSALPLNRRGHILSREKDWLLRIAFEMVDQQCVNPAIALIISSWKRVSVT